MSCNPRYEFIDALTTAATEANGLLHSQYNPDVIFWETLEVNRIRDAGGFIVGMINEVGYQDYLNIRDKIANS